MTGDRKRIILVDDHKMFREGLVFMISKLKNFKIVGEASNGKTFLKLLDEIEADIIVMDISMPGMDGVDATKKALSKNPDLKVIALTMFCDEENYYKMVQAGVSGYVLKDSGKDELIEALESVVMGENFFSQRILHHILVSLNNTKTNKIDQEKEKVKLTNRESEILTMICQGFSNSEISDKLCLSLRTVEGHKSNLLSKTGVKNSISLVMYAIKNRYVNV